MAPDKTLGYIVTINVTTDGTTIVTGCRTMKDPQRNATSPTCVIPGDGIEIDVHDLDAEIDDRATHHFLRAVRGTIEPRTGPAKEADQPSLVRAGRLLSDAALSADEAARNEHRRHVVAPLLMLLAIGLLYEGLDAAEAACRPEWPALLDAIAKARAAADAVLIMGPAEPVPGD